MTLAYQLFSDSLNSVPFSLTPQNGVNSEESNVKPFSALVKEILACAPKWSLTELKKHKPLAMLHIQNVGQIGDRK